MTRMIHNTRITLTSTLNDYTFRKKLYQYHSSFRIRLCSRPERAIHDTHTHTHTYVVLYAWVEQQTAQTFFTGKLISFQASSVS